MTQVLREAVNVVRIVGIVEEVNIESKTFEKTVEGKKTKSEVLTGEVLINVDGDIHTVSVFSNKFKADGSENGIYKGLQTIKDEYKSIKVNGIDEADKVRITAGKVGRNEYIGQDGDLKSFPQISSNFIQRLNSGDDFTPEATFTLEMFVEGHSMELKNDEETGRLILKGAVPLYGGKLIPFDVVVEESDAVDYVESNYDKGSTVTVFGTIVNQRIVTERTIPAAFGKDKKETSTTYIREYKVEGGNDPSDVDEAKLFDVDLIKAAKKVRVKFIEELKEKKANSGTSNSNKPSSGNKGFGSKPANIDKQVTIDEDDLPFWFALKR